MKLLVLFGFLVASFWFVDGAGSGCQDIDHSACASMAKQNANLCLDQILSKTACPQYCNTCPVTCYNCNSTTTDVSNCNTVTCNPGEMCLRTTISVTGINHKYQMTCSGAPFCSIARKRHQDQPEVLDIESRGVSIDRHCCDSDLCNSPVQPTSTTTKATTSSTRPTVRQTPPVTHATQSPGCQRDIIIMLEESLDLNLYYFFIRNSIQSVLSNLDIGHDKTRVALGTFGVNSATKRWDLDRYTTKQGILSAVHNLQMNGHQSNANNLVAIQYVLNNFAQGNRNHVPDEVLFITEGHTLHYFSHHKEDVAISNLHQMSHNVIVVGLGAVNADEVKQISTDNNHFIYIRDVVNYFTTGGSIVPKLTYLLGCN